MKKQYIIIILGIIIFIAFILRILYLSADPLNINFLATRDEGLYSYAARSMALFGKWQTDNFNYGRIMPIFPALQLIGVKIFGIHSYSFRLVSVFFSILTIFVLYCFLKKQISWRAGIVGSILLSSNFMYLVFSRSGLPEATMMFFSFLSFIFYFYVLIHRSNVFKNSFLSGVFFMLAFFTKQSMISLIMVPMFVFVYLFVKNRPKAIKAILGFFTPVLLISIFYFFNYYLTNPKEWYENYLATIDIHRIRRVFLSSSYIQNQVKEFIFNDYWKYEGVLFIGILINLVDSVTHERFSRCEALRNSSQSASRGNPSHFVTSTKFKDINKSNTLLILCFLWLIFIMLHMFFAPAKFGRFYVIGVIPLIIMFSYLINTVKGRIKYILYLLIVLDISYNGFLIYKNILTNQKYSYMSAVNDLNKTISNKDLVNLPVHWMMNVGFKTINPFLVPAKDLDLFKFYNKYGWPKYISIIDYQGDIYKKNTPKLLAKYDFYKKVNDYMIFRMKEK